MSDSSLPALGKGGGTGESTCAKEHREIQPATTDDTVHENPNSNDQINRHQDPTQDGGASDDCEKHAPTCLVSAEYVGNQTDSSSDLECNNVKRRKLGSDRASDRPNGNNPKSSRTKPAKGRGLINKSNSVSPQHTSKSRVVKSTAKSTWDSSDSDFEHQLFVEKKPDGHKRQPNNRAETSPCGSHHRDKQRLSVKSGQEPVDCRNKSDEESAKMTEPVQSSVEKPDDGLKKIKKSADSAARSRPGSESASSRGSRSGGEACKRSSDDRRSSKQHRRYSSSRSSSRRRRSRSGRRSVSRSGSRHRRSRRKRSRSSYSRSRSSSSASSWSRRSSSRRGRSRSRSRSRYRRFRPYKRRYRRSYYSSRSRTRSRSRYSSRSSSSRRSSRYASSRDSSVSRGRRSSSRDVNYRDQFRSRSSTRQEGQQDKRDGVDKSHGKSTRTPVLNSDIAAKTVSAVFNRVTGAKPNHEAAIANHDEKTNHVKSGPSNRIVGDIPLPHDSSDMAVASASDDSQTPVSTTGTYIGPQVSPDLAKRLGLVVSADSDQNSQPTVTPSPVARSSPVAAVTSSDCASRAPVSNDFMIPPDDVHFKALQEQAKQHAQRNNTGASVSSVHPAYFNHSIGSFNQLADTSASTSSSVALLQQLGVIASGAASVPAYAGLSQSLISGGQAQYPALAQLTESIRLQNQQQNLSPDVQTRLAQILLASRLDQNQLAQSAYMQSYATPVSDTSLQQPRPINTGDLSSLSALSTNPQALAQLMLLLQQNQLTMAQNQQQLNQPNLIAQVANSTMPAALRPNQSLAAYASLPNQTAPANYTANLLALLQQHQLLQKYLSRPVNPIASAAIAAAIQQQQRPLGQDGRASKLNNVLPQSSSVATPAAGSSSSVVNPWANFLLANRLNGSVEPVSTASLGVVNGMDPKSAATLLASLTASDPNVASNLGLQFNVRMPGSVASNPLLNPTAAINLVQQQQQQQLAMQLLRNQQQSQHQLEAKNGTTASIMASATATANQNNLIQAAQLSKLNAIAVQQHQQQQLRQQQQHQQAVAAAVFANSAMLGGGSATGQQGHHPHQLRKPQ